MGRHDLAVPASCRCPVRSCVRVSGGGAMTEADVTEVDEGATTAPTPIAVSLIGEVSIAASLSAIVVLWARQVTVLGPEWGAHLVSSQCVGTFGLYGSGYRAESAYLLPLAIGLALIGVLTAPVAPIRSRSTWATLPVAVLGLAVTAWSSGLGRDGQVVFDANTSQECSGHVESSMLPAGIALGAGIVIAVGVWAIARRWATGHGWWAVATNVAVLAATIALSVVTAMSPIAHGVGGIGISVGRPLRDRGHRRRPAHPPGGWPGGHWHSTAVDEAVAAASFEHVAQELEVLGAPGTLIDRCRAAADDERRHARLCLRLIDVDLIQPDQVATSATATEPGRATLLPVVAVPRIDVSDLRRHRRTHLLRVALEAHLDGVRNEGAAAADMHRTADELAADPTAAPWASTMARSIALDEERHAALNADIVSWAWRSARHGRRSPRIGVERP